MMTAIGSRVFAHRHAGGGDYYIPGCEGCQALATQQKADWRRKNPEASRRSKKRHRQGVRDWVNAIKESTPCADCGRSYPSYVMQFDHRDPEKKAANVARLVGSGIGRQAIEREMDKCDIVCSNCHAERTWG